MITVSSLLLGPLDTNCYYVTDGASALLVDPAVCDETLTSFLNRQSVAPSAVLLTHGHFDHISGAVPYLKNHDIPLYIGEKDRICLSNTRYSLALLIPGFRQTFLSGDEEIKTLSGGETFTVGEMTIEVLPLPGHSMGGVGYYFRAENLLFCGDTVFCGSVGRTDFPGSDPNDLLHSVNLVASLPENTKLYPGHGTATTVGAEKQNNPYFRGSL